MKSNLLECFSWRCSPGCCLADMGRPKSLTNLPIQPAGAKHPRPLPKRELSQEELEHDQFAETLVRGATLAGHFSVDGLEAGALPSEDRYAISKVTKLEGEVWKFDVRIVYGQHDVTLPLPLTVKWAGDTPVITLTDLAIPGLGIYTAGCALLSWPIRGHLDAQLDHGGEMWGRIEKPAGSEPDKKKAEKEIRSRGQRFQQQNLRSIGDQADGFPWMAILSADLDAVRPSRTNAADGHEPAGRGFDSQNAPSQVDRLPTA